MTLFINNSNLVWKYYEIKFLIKIKILEHQIKHMCSNKDTSAFCDNIREESQDLELNRG